MALDRKFRHDSSSRKRTVTFLQVRLVRCTFVHFLLVWSPNKYSLYHLVQHLSAITWTLCHCDLYVSLVPNYGISFGSVPIFWVKRLDGAKMVMSSGSEEMSAIGVQLRTALISTISVTSTSWLWSLMIFLLIKFPFKIIRATPIICSNTPPKWETFGGLKPKYGNFLPSSSSLSHLLPLRALCPIPWLLRYSSYRYPT